MTASAEGAVQLRVSRDEVERLVPEVGHAFYLLDLDRMRANHDTVLQAFRARYGETVLAYSVKTNSMPRVLKQIRQLGSKVEVVSELEYEIATRVGFSPAEILINGPLHEEAFLRQVLATGLSINLDGWYMLDTLHQLSTAHPAQRFKVGLRLSYPIPGAAWSRFGFEATATNMRRLAAWFGDHANCEVVGLHSHFPLAAKSAETFRARLAGLVEAKRSWFPDAALAYLDLGGGMDAEIDAQQLAEIADAVTCCLEEGFSSDPRPALIIEPGSAIIAAAMAFVCRVYDVKTIEGRRLALVNGSNHNINTMMWHQRFAVDVLRSPAAGCESAGTFDIVGNTCMERKDLICTGVPGPVAPGDYIVFDRVGAYSTALKPPFIHPCPAVVARQRGHYEVVKRRETADDILRTFLI